MRGNTVTCKRCHRPVARINNSLEIEFFSGARLINPTEGTFRLADATLACSGGHRFKIG